MLPQIEAKKLALVKWAPVRRPVAHPATEKAVLGCVSLWAKGDDRALSCSRVRIGHA